MVIISFAPEVGLRDSWTRLHLLMVRQLDFHSRNRSSILRGATMKIRIIKKRWFTPPWGGHDGVTLYPFIFLRPGASASLLRHELIHIWQVRRLGFWRFYVGYLWRKLTGTGYREEFTEIAAYKYQNNPQFLPKDLEALVKEHANTTLVGKLHK